MIAKKGWFKRRKYSGWGATPATWQGWVYTLALVAPFALLAITGASAETQFAVSVAWSVVLVFAFVDIMASIEKDERESIHEAYAERNALWVMIAILAAGMAFQVASGIARGTATAVDPVIIVALFAGLMAKAITNYYLDHKD